MPFVNKPVQTQDRDKINFACSLLGERSDIVFAWTSNDELDCQLICFSVGHNRSDIGGEPGRYALLLQHRVVAFEALRIIDIKGPGYSTFATYRIAKIRQVKGDDIPKAQINMLIEASLGAKEMGYEGARGASIIFESGQ